MIQTFLNWQSAAGTLSAAALSLFVLKRVESHLKLRQVEKERPNRLVVITGCDTGLGYSMAVWAGKLGYKVLATCLNENGEGAQKLKRQFRDQVIIAGLNVTDKNNLESFHTLCREILQTNEGKLRLWAVITNAAVCTMGEFFWQTRNQREQQMNVNFWGTVNLIAELRTMLFETKARVIVISSDCSQYPLPYLSAYSASKSALNAWTQSFRFEVAKYGIHVVAYQPRDFAEKSGILSNIGMHYNEMTSEMSNSEKEFYGDYFEKFMQHKQETFETAKKKATKLLSSGKHRESIIYLLENDIQRISVYQDFSLMEKVFRFMYRRLPQRMVDSLVTKVLNPANIPWTHQDRRALSG